MKHIFYILYLHVSIITCWYESQ